MSLRGLSTRNWPVTKLQSVILYTELLLSNQKPRYTYTADMKCSCMAKEDFYIANWTNSNSGLQQCVFQSSAMTALKPTHTSSLFTLSDHPA